MYIQLPQSEWEKIIKKQRDLREELNSQTTGYLQGMVEGYIKMEPFVSIKSLFGSDDLDRLRTGQRILIRRELGDLTNEELSKISTPIHPARELVQFFHDCFDYNINYVKREMALEILGKNKGMPYWGK